MTKTISNRSFERLARLILTAAIFPEKSGWQAEYKGNEVICDTCGNKLVYFTPTFDYIEITDVNTLNFHRYYRKGV